MNPSPLIALVIALCLSPGVHAADQASASSTHAQTEKQKPRQPAIAMPKPVSPPAQADEPIPLVGCDAGGCRDTAGNQYNSSGSGPGTTYLNSAGRPCTRHKLWMQCF